MRSWERLICEAFAARRRWVTWALAVALLIAGTGFPVPGPTHLGGKDHGRPFPCQDRPCGCRTAEQCWRSCCCFTAEQKLAWATRNRVAAPDFVVAAALASAKSSPRPSAGACCRQASDDCGRSASAPPSRRGSPTPESRGSTAPENRDCPAPDSRPSPAPENRGRSIVITALALQCQGLSSLWTVVAGALPPAAVQAPIAANPPVCRRVALDEHPSFDRAAPPVPPPRG